MNTNESDGLRKHNNWVVACLDILGQTEAMKEIDFVDSQMSEEERKLFENGVKKVYKSTQLLHETIDHWVVKSQKTPPPFQNLSKEEEQYWERTNGRPLNWQRFSDGLIVYSSLADPLELSCLRFERGQARIWFCIQRLFKRYTRLNRQARCLPSI